MPKPQKGYIHLILPRHYLIGISPPNTVQTPSTHTYSKNEIVGFLDQRQLKSDLPRTFWKFGEEKERPFGSSKDGVSSTIQEALNSKGGKELKLTEDETTALYIFSACNASKEALQGGFFRYIEVSIPIWLHENAASIQKKSLLRVNRNEKSHLVVLASVAFFDENDKEKPILIYANEYQLTQQGENFTLTHSEQPEYNSILIREDYFLQRIFNSKNEQNDSILFRLQNTNFDQKDINLFVPFLAYPHFRIKFFEKLQNTAVSSKALSYLLDKLQLLELKLSFWQRHQWKVIFLIISSIICAAAIATILLTIGPIGGILLFSLLAPTSSLILILASLAGGVLMDKENNQDAWIPNTLKRIQALRPDDGIKDDEEIIENSEQEPEITTDDESEEEIPEKSNQETETTDEENQEEITERSDHETEDEEGEKTSPTKRP